MKFSISLILFSTSIVIFVGFNEAYGPLIKNIHNKYETDGVVIALGTRQKSFERHAIWHETVRILSREGIRTRIVNLQKFEDKVEVYRGRPIRTLIVIAFDTIKELHTFESITNDFSMSYSIWLIIFTSSVSRNLCEFCHNPHGSLSNLRLSSKVLISCCDSGMLEEWWYIEKNRTKSQQLGRLMDGDAGIAWFSDELLNGNRYAMNGQALRIVAARHSVFFEAKDGEYYGYLGEVIKELSRAMNFTISEIIWDNDYGLLDPETLNWTGVIGKIHRREADIGVSDFLMTKDRFHVISFTSPFAFGSMQLYIGQHYTAKPRWNAYFKTFTSDVWMAIIGLILITSILLTLIKYKRNSNFFSLFFEHHLLVWGIYCHQGLPKFPNKTSSRIVYVSILLSAVVTSTAYSASMTSILAVSSDTSFNTIEELVQDGTYKVTALDHYLIHAMLPTSDNVLIKKLWSLVIPKDSLPRSVQEAFEQICNDRVAFFVHDTTMKSMINAIPCEITPIGTRRVEPLSMIVPRGSSYLESINHYIRRFRANGILGRLEQKYFKALQQSKPGYSPVHRQGVKSIFLILAVGFLIAFTIFIIERIFFLSRNKLRNRKKRKISTFF